MQRFLAILVICLVGIIYLGFDTIVEKINELKTPTFSISVVRPSLGTDGTLTFKVMLKNVTDSPIGVAGLGITYVIFPDDNSYEYKNTEIEVRETLDPKQQLDIPVVLADYVNPLVDPTASSWVRNKKKKFGIKISVKDYSDKTLQWTKIRIDPAK
jgi:hypothetical protein